MKIKLSWVSLSLLAAFAYSRELSVLAAGVVKAGNSDHLPVFAVFERAEGARR